MIAAAPVLSRLAKSAGLFWIVPSIINVIAAVYSSCFLFSPKYKLSSTPLIASWASFNF
ncbi:hypothetical protein CCUG63695_01559 [Mycobacteroides franklinii]|nr:hypothetical protein CCUG63695_01559 [Mycobacteroides franklinii]